MKSTEYNKLIRDRIPEIIEKSGKEPIYRIAEGDELLYLLNAKLYEELNEYSESGDIEELADLYEVILSVLEYKGVHFDEFENIRVKKRDERGSFTKGYVLEEVRDLTNFQQEAKDVESRPNL